MSRINTEAIWQPDKVLPYLFGELKQKIEAITPIQQIYLYGSRATTPVADWEKLEGKDWDILIICPFAIVNTVIWTRQLNYHIDLRVVDAVRAEQFLKHGPKLIELYPENKLPLNVAPQPANN